MNNERGPGNKASATADTDATATEIASPQQQQGHHLHHQQHQRHQQLLFDL